VKTSTLLPPPGVARTLSIQSIIYAIGNGIFTTGSAIFFLRVVRLTPVQVGIGFSIAGALALITAVPLGGLADRFGGRRTWFIGAMAEATVLLSYPFIRGFWLFLAVLSLITLAGSVGNAGRGVYTVEALPREDRVRSMAFIRAALNIGFFIGGGLAAIPLAIGTNGAFAVMALANAAGMFANAVMIIRMPELTRHADAQKPKQRAREVFRDRPFMVLVVVVGILTSHGTMFTEVIPLWLAARTDAPKAMLAILFGINTIMAVALQVLASRGANSLGGIARLLRWGGFAGALACGPLYLSGMTSGWATILLLAAGVVLITASELWQSAGAWGVTTEIPPPAHRGAYIGASKMGGSAQSMVAPAALTWLAIHGGGFGWLAIAVIFAGSSLSVGPIMSWISRTPRIGAPDQPSPPEPTGPLDPPDPLVASDPLAPVGSALSDGRGSLTGVTVSG